MTLSPRQSRSRRLPVRATACARRVVLPTLAGLTISLATFHARAQTSSGNSRITEVPSVPGSRDDRSDDSSSMLHELERKQQRSREVDRQKRLVDDTKRLVELTILYRKSAESHNAPTPEDQRLLAQIEKLAHSVRERARGM